MMTLAQAHTLLPDSVLVGDGTVELARVHDPLFDASTIEHRPSSTGKYMGVTLHINATSRVQLDAVYGALTSHPMVKVVL